MDKIYLRPAAMGDLNTLLAFEQELIAAERPYEPALKAEKNNKNATLLHLIQKNT